MHTALIDERLQEAERKLANDSLATRDLDRRVTRAEVDTAATSERSREHSMRLEALTSQFTAMTQSLQAEHERRWAQLDEQLSAHARRSVDDRAQLEQIIEEVRRSTNQRAARAEKIANSMASRLDAGNDDNAGRVNALANEFARLSIDLRSELAQALSKALRTREIPVEPTRIIDLTDPVPSSVDLRQ